MKTLNQVAYNVLNLVRGGRSTNNEHISLEQIKYTILYYRELLIRRDSDEKGFPSFREVEQTLADVPLSVLDPASGSLHNLTERGLMLRTEKRLPRPVRMKRTEGIVSVHSPDFRYAYPLVDPARVRYLRYGKFTGDTPRSTYENGYVWVTGSALTQQIQEVIDGNLENVSEESILSHPLMITIRGIFADPREAYGFATGKEWDDDTCEFPLSGDYEQRIVSALLSGEFQIRKNDINTDMLPDQ